MDLLSCISTMIWQLLKLDFERIFMNYELNVCSGMWSSVSTKLGSFSRSYETMNTFFMNYELHVHTWILDKKINCDWAASVEAS